MRITTIMAAVTALVLTAATATAQTPSMTITGNGQPGTKVFVEIGGANPGALFACVSGFKRGVFHLPPNFGGARSIDIADPRVTFGGWVSPSGNALVSFKVPARNTSHLAGVIIYFQAAVVTATQGDPGARVAKSAVQALILP